LVGGALHTIFIVIPTEAMLRIAQRRNLANDLNNHPPVTYAHPPKPLKYVKKSQNIFQNPILSTIDKFPPYWIITAWNTGENVPGN